MPHNSDKLLSLSLKQIIKKYNSLRHSKANFNYFMLKKKKKNESANWEYLITLLAY